MSRSNPVNLIVFAAAIVAVLGGVSLMKGGIYIAKHEGDTLHLLEIVLRMAEGQMPHRDFVTPIGILAFAPISFFVSTGMGVGHAFLWAQILVALVMLPLGVWAAWSRLTGWISYLFLAFVLVLPLALVHGEAEQSISLSMHYNRFAWTLAFVAILLAILPRLRGAASIDGMVIGFCMAALALLKITYFVCFAPPIIIALLMRKEMRSLLAAILAGLAVVAAMTLYAGVSFWGAYIIDLLTVMTSGVRSAPSASFNEVAGAPAYLPGTLLAFMGVILLRQAREEVGGLVLLLLIPGFFYVTYQNFGNDPQWLWLLAVILFALMPAEGLKNGFGWDLRKSTLLVAVGVLTASAPSFINLIYSPFRHLASEVEDFQPLLTRSAVHDDLKMHAVRTQRVNLRVAGDTPGQPWEAYRDRGRHEEDEIQTIKGEELAYCELDIGTATWMESIAVDLEQQGFATGETTLFVADLLPTFWLYSDKLAPTPQGAPWYYGGLPGFEASDYTIVPLCPIVPKVRGMILDALEERGTDDLTEVYRNGMYILFQRQS